MLSQRITFFSFLLLLIFTNSTSAQKMLRIDKTGSTKIRKLYIGDYLTFQLKGENEPWETEKIKDIDTKQGIIHFAYYFINLNDIKIIKFDRTWARSGGMSLIAFGATWGLYSLAAAPFGNELKTNSWAVPAVGIGLGYGLLKILGSKKYKLGKKYKLLLLDTSFN